MVDYRVRRIKFSNYSKILICGIGCGYLNAYDITNNFKLIYDDRVN